MDKLGFLEVTIDFALKIPELRDGLIEFLESKKELQTSSVEEAEIEVVVK